MEPKTLTLEQIEAQKTLDRNVTELCMVAADYQERFGDLPVLERNCRVGDKIVCIIACLVPTLTPDTKTDTHFRENIL